VGTERLVHHKYVCTLIGKCFIYMNVSLIFPVRLYWLINFEVIVFLIGFLWVGVMLRALYYKLGKFLSFMPMAPRPV